ncbi:hypothetical protein LTR33_019245, partial [Friedmanniomyces endolithicus]
MLLFKEKINYKLAGAGGDAAHIDSSAYTHVKKIKHLAVNIAVDSMTPSNGGLEIVKGSHKMHVPIAADNCIEPAWIVSQAWIPVELAAGDALILGSSLARRISCEYEPTGPEGVVCDVQLCWRRRPARRVLCETEGGVATYSFAEGWRDVRGWCAE